MSQIKSILLQFSKQLHKFLMNERNTALKFIFRTKLYDYYSLFNFHYQGFVLIGIFSS